MSRKRPASLSNSSSHHFHSNNNNMLLAHLPLRPSTQQLLRTRGFATVQEVMDSCRNNSNGLSNLAAELGTPLQTAGGVWQEILQQVVQQQQQQQQRQVVVDHQGNNNNNNNNKTNQGSNAAAQKENHPQSNAITNTATTTSSNSNNNNSSNINNNSGLYLARSRPRTAQEILLSQQPFAVGNNNTTTTTTITNHAILTFCRDIDQLLAGGIALGELIELAGLPGTGKTQWAMQLAVDCSLPVWIGGVCGQTCYIDTEGSFCPERCHAMATALIQHIQRGMMKRQQHKTTTNSWNVTADDILRGIHVIRVHDQADLQATLTGTLPRLVQEQAGKTPLRLVVVDSMAFPIRAAVPPQSQQGNNNNNSSHVDFYVERNRLLTVAAQQLAQLAAQYHLAAVAINQMTTKFVPTATSNNSNSNNTTTSSQMVPALGEAWAHAVTTRILLSSSSQAVVGRNNAATAPPVIVRRTCSLVKSPRLPAGSADYQILECGIRGVNHNNDNRSSSS